MVSKEGQPGYLIGYFYVCKRRCWYALHHIRCEHLSDLVKLGKVISEHNKFRGKREVELERCKLDLLDLKSGTVFEIKLGKTADPASVWQVKYYLWKAKKSGHKDPVGILKLHSGRKQIMVKLDNDEEVELERAEQEIYELKYASCPPPPQKLPYCKKCSYYELCWI